MSSAPDIAFHPLVENLRPILGIWRGNGEGSFPTLSSSFRYTEELCFEAVHPTKPVVAYSHRTAHADTGAPMHRESGFMKLLPEGKFIWAVAQATGMTEVADGSWDAQTGTHPAGFVLVAVFLCSFRDTWHDINSNLRRGQSDARDQAVLCHPKLIELYHLHGYQAGTAADNPPYGSAGQSLTRS